MQKGIILEMNEYNPQLGLIYTYLPHYYADNVAHFNYCMPYHEVWQVEVWYNMLTIYQISNYCNLNYVTPRYFKS